jgi:hypothetical protein
VDNCPALAESMRLIVVRPLLIDCSHAREEAVTLLNIPFATDLSGGSVRSKDTGGFVVGDDAEYAFACTMTSWWEGARA